MPGTTAQQNTYNYDLQMSPWTSGTIPFIPAQLNTPWPPPTMAPAPVTPQVNNQAADMLTQLYNDIMAQGPVPVTQNQSMSQTQTQKQNPSPELESQIDQYMQQLNALMTGMNEAYTGVQGTYDALLKSVSDAYRTKATDVSSQQSKAALASGLTPLEAAGLGSEANLNVLQQMFPQLATLEADKARVAVELQTALAELQRGNYLPLLQAVMSPYYQNLAGQTMKTTQQGTTQTFDPYAQQNLLTSIGTSLLEDENAQDALWLEYEKMLRAQGLSEQELAQQQEQFYATIDAERQRTNQIAQLESAQSAQDLEEQLALIAAGGGGPGGGGGNYTWLALPAESQVQEV